MSYRFRFLVIKPVRNWLQQVLSSPSRYALASDRKVEDLARQIDDLKAEFETYRLEMRKAVRRADWDSAESRKAVAAALERFETLRGERQA